MAEGCIVAVRGDAVRVRLQAAQGCGACRGVFVAAAHQVTVAAPRGHGYRVGEAVRVRLDGVSAGWCVCLYLAPLGGFLLGAGAGTMVFRHEWAVFAASVGALCVVLLVMRWRYLRRRRSGLLRPVLVRCAGERELCGR